jgi:hypothetical protein
VLVLGNFSEADVRADVPDAVSWATAELVLGNYATDDHGGEGDAIDGHAIDDRLAHDGSGSTRSGGIALRPWEARVYRRVVGARQRA